MATKLCRWGILGTATIARKNWKAIRNSGNGTLVAVASRDRAKAQKFIDECQSFTSFSPSPAPCGSYEELIANPNIDALYIPIPTGIRRDWVLRAVQAGKHVLCEKPCGVSSADVAAMVDACKQKRVQFMDGVMFMHSERLALIERTLNDGKTVGKPMRVSSQFSFKANDEFLAGNIRVSSELEPQGCVGDLGWYNIRFSLCVAKERMPERVSGRLLKQHAVPGGKPVPTDFTGELFFSDGLSATFYCSFLAANQQWAHVSGEEGSMHMPDFVLPFFGSEAAFTTNTPAFHPHGCDFNMQDRTRRHAVVEYSNSMPNSQETNMIRRFSQIVLSGQLEPRWGELALKTQRIVDACLRSAHADGKLVPVE